MAHLIINQAGLSAGVADRSRSDGLRTGALVTLTHDESNAVFTSYELLWIPIDDKTAVSSFITIGNTATFTPDSTSIGGTYRIRLRVTTATSSTETIRLFAIRTVHGIRIPALNERANELASLQFNGAQAISDSEFNEPSVSGPFASGNYGGWYSAYNELVQRVETLSGSGAVPALQPIDSDVVAAWKNEYIPGGTGDNAMQLVDYSGNGYTGAAKSGLLTVPDLVPGRLTQFGWLTNYNSPPNPEQIYSVGDVASGLTVPSYGPATEILGDLTFTVRLAMSGHQGAFPLYQYIYSHGDDGAAGGGRGQSFGCGINANDYRVFVYWSDLSATNPSSILFSTTISTRLRSFQHCFFSVVRDATAKTLRLGIDGVYETQSYTQVPPPSRTGRYPFIGAPPSSTTALPGLMGFCGSVTNPVIRNKTRTDAQLEAIRKTTMGLP